MSSTATIDYFIVMVTYTHSWLRYLCSARYYLARQAKFPQIFIHGESNCGKSPTLTPLGMALKAKRPSPWTHFINTQLALCLLDELTGETIKAFTTADLNCIVEGRKQGYYAVKNSSQRYINWQGHVILLYVGLAS